MAIILDYNKHVKSEAVLKKNRDSMLDSFDSLLKKLHQAESLGLIPAFIKEGGVYHVKDSVVNKLLEEVSMGDVVDLKVFRQRKEQDKSIGRGKKNVPNGLEFGYRKENVIKNEMTYKTKSPVTADEVTLHLLKVKELLQKSIDLEVGIATGVNYLTREKAVVDSLEAREAAFKYAKEHDITISKDENGNFTITNNTSVNGL